MAKYYLISYNEEDDVEKELIIEDDELSDTKVKDSLPAIDLFTSEFEDEYDLKEYLRNYNLLSDDDKILIRYDKKGYKYLPVVYEKDRILSPFYNEKSATLRTDTPYFSEQFGKLLKCSSNREYVTYLYQHKYINEHLAKNLRFYSPFDESSIQTTIFLSIQNDLASYRVIRDIYFGTRAFKNGSHRINGAFPYSREIACDDEENVMEELYKREGEEGLFAQYSIEQVLRYPSLYNKIKKG